MSKKYTKKELENKIIHVMMISLQHVQDHARQLKEFELTDEDWQAEDPSDKVKKGRELLYRMNLLNYIMQPLFEVARPLSFSTDLIDACEKNYKQCVQDKVFPPKCDCPGCNER